ncbi:MAG: sulfatase [Pirellulaceae bacterium]|nr:MAG: sulfatase [Pirellulaceae bacterium]
MISRREALQRCGIGFGGLALHALLQEAARAAETSATDRAVNPLAPRSPHFAPRAKRVIHIFANGGPSHVDTFDPKPALQKYAGQPMPGETPRTERKTGALFPCPFRFQRYGESGIPVSEIFQHTARHVDDMCIIRSMHADVPNHEPSLLLMNTGEARLVRPSVGSWLTYGLGTDNQNLPAFVAMCPGGYPIQESQNWQSGFLPGIYQGTYVDTQHEAVDKLIEYIDNDRVSRPVQQRQLALLQQLNRRHQQQRDSDPQLEARIQAFELAFRMQLEAAEVFDVSREPSYILDRYGPGVQARQLLIARRLIENGVRYVQVWHGAGQPWDNHDDLEVRHRQLAQQCDRAISALLTDLKERGLLEETLVLWGGEFGRTPTVELPKEGSNQGKVNGRDHNHWGFTMWMAGGGVRGGTVYGATDEFGFKAVENRVHVHDLHATMLHLLGFDHKRFTYRWAGRDFRLTDVHGRVIHDIIA